MSALSAISPESLGYLPAVFRAETELQASAGEQEDPLPILLRVFEGNLHLAERMIEQSHRWFQPWQSTAFANAASPPWFSASDIVQPKPMATRLARSDEHDPVSAFLRQHLSPETGALLQRVIEGETIASTLQEFAAALALDLNHLLRAGNLYDARRFALVRFSPETKALLAHPHGSDATDPRLGRLLLQDAFPRELAAIPAASAFLGRSWEREFLGWLAGWLDLEPNREWFESPPRAEGGEFQLGGERYPRFKRILTDIASLYRLRGTSSGLCQMARALLGLEVEVRERTWPRGLEVGRHSAIGLDTLLVEPPDLDTQFVLLVPIAGTNRQRLPTPGVGREVSLLGENPGTAWLPEISEATAEERASGLAWSALLHRLNHLVELNKPAHTRCFIAFLFRLPASSSLPPMVIGRSSTVSHFLIL